MGTNFFCVEKISRRQRSKIKSLLREYIEVIDKVDTACYFHKLHSKYNEMISDIIPEKVHLGKRAMVVNSFGTTTMGGILKPIWKA